MASEETIVNKIVSIDTILDIAKYLEEKKQNMRNYLLMRK